MLRTIFQYFIGLLLSMRIFNISNANIFQINRFMKNTLHLNFLFCFLIFLTSVNISGQTTFRKLTDGPIVNTPTDSRSINFADFNFDGLEDILITFGNSSGASDIIYLNKGNGVFEEQPQLLNQIKDPSVGATIGDMNNDGYPDIFVASWYNRKNAFFQGQPNTTFATSVMHENSYSESAAWGDYDQDGYLDLYVCNSGNNAGENYNFFYKNNFGNLNIQTNHSLTNETNNSRSSTWIDYDNDADIDLFVCNEKQTKNDLFRNDGNGIFTKITSAGDLLLDTSSSMSASWGDINHDGWMDVFICNTGFYVSQPNRLFINNGNGTFTKKAGIFEDDNGCSYSSSFADYDNDGDLDLFVSNGFCKGVIQNFLYLNDGDGNFTRDVSSITDLQTPCSFGTAWGDINNDGFQDLVIANCKNSSQTPFSHNTVWLNDGNGNKWIKVKLKGTASNIFGIGARIYTSALISGKRVNQIRDITSVTGYCSQNSLIAHFGLKNAAIVDTLIVYWPSGITQILTQMPVNEMTTIVEPIINQTTEQKSDVSLRISPNPSGTSVLIEAAFQAKVDTLHIDIRSLSGTLLYSNTLYDVNNKLYHNIDNQKLQMGQGIYLIQAYSKTWSISKKIFIRE